MVQIKTINYIGMSIFDMSPEVHCNLCNHCYTLGMSDQGQTLGVYSTYHKYIIRCLTVLSIKWNL